MKIAVIGSGIAGLTAAYYLAEQHDVSLLESSARLGGHTHTVDLSRADGRVAVDTAFMVFNARTYPNFCHLLRALGIDSQPSDMSFSVRSARRGWEYCGSTLSGLFAQRGNLLDPAFYRMLWDITQFNRRAARLIEQETSLDLTLGDFLREQPFGQDFRDSYLLPMAAAIWSSPPADILRFPAVALARFFANHGLLSLRDRPQWLTVAGGARRYIDAILRTRRLTVRCNSPVQRVLRSPTGVQVAVNGQDERFDHVVIAVHADDALRLLGDASGPEREVLGAFSYQPNTATLHTDEALMPSKRRAWASWNYHVSMQPQQAATVTYWLNRLQHLPTREDIFVTLNDPGDIRPGRVLEQFDYRHPLFTSAALAAQHRHAEISTNRTHYCGAYWGNGFHEDGVTSGLAAVRSLEESNQKWKVACTRATCATAVSPT